MASISRVLYIGVTNHLAGRVEQHKLGIKEGFTKRYRCQKLVYYEEYQYIDEAIAREKQLKKWRREKKEALIHTMNADWIDLAYSWDVETEDFSTLPRVRGDGEMTKKHSIDWAMGCIPI